MILLGNATLRYDTTSLPSTKKSNLTQAHNETLKPITPAVAQLQGTADLVNLDGRADRSSAALFPKRAAVMACPSGALNTSQLVAHPFLARSSLPER